MILYPQFEDIKIIGYYLGRICILLGLCMLIPLVLGLLWGELNPALDFTISSLISFIFGFLLIILCKTEKDLNWMQGMILVSLSWLVAMFLGAIPLYLSGHMMSFLDSCFDAMSGFATTGLILIQDLDHLSFSHNLWRHLMMFIGGQGIVVVAISFFVRTGAGALKLYMGEAREERVLPNVIQTARFIWMVSLVYLVLGTLTLGTIAMQAGIPLKRAFFHGLCIFMAAFDTGGFAPQSQNILYYHSFALEVATLTIMLLGAINFNLHYALWTGNRRELWRNIEIRTLLCTMLLLSALVFFDLARASLYPKFSLFRKGLYQFLSAHTGTGYSNLYSQQFMGEWGRLSLLGLILAMGLGGSVCSTTGGIKALRLGLVFKGILLEVKRIMLPESTQIKEKFHHLRDITLEDRHVRIAAFLILLYLLTYLLGTLAGTFCGYPFLNSLFESTSAAANVGLSCGITSPAMPSLLKLIFIFQMWVGRLEFMSVFVLIGFMIAMVRGKK